MMRRYLFPLLLLLLTFPFQTAHAETTPATYHPVSTSAAFWWPSTHNISVKQTSPQSACNIVGSVYGQTLTAVQTYPSEYSCKSGNSAYGTAYKACNDTSFNTSLTLGGVTYQDTAYCYKNLPYYTCPDSSWTLMDSTCSRPDCPAGVTRDSNGVCLSACEQVKGLINGTPQATRWYMVPVGSNNATGDFCDSGCAAKLAIAGTGYYTDGKMNSVQRTIMYTGQSCTNEPNAPQQFTPDKPAPPVPEKKPPCAAGDGVMTSSSGTIGCVPEGTPNSNPPVVKKEKETKTNADGTTATTETTTTRDPSTGVEQKTSTTTTKDANGNTTGVTSTSGTSGTTSGGNPEKPGDSDFCQKNPTLDICTGKLNKEETQKKIADDIKSLTNPGTTSTDPLKNATHTMESENQLKTENDKFTDAAKGITDPTASSKSSWQQAMESGWFSAIPSSGCTPITGTVGGRQFTIDHCEKASQISDIMSYALWFMLVVGSFVMFTGGQVRTQ